MELKKLKLLDYDIVDPPTTVRWPLGLSAFAAFKTDALKQFLSSNYLHTEVEVYLLKLGNTRVDGKASLPFNKAPHWKSVECAVAGLPAGGEVGDFRRARVCNLFHSLVIVF